MHPALNTTVLQKVSAGDYVGKERLDILHQVMMNSEAALAIYRRLPQTTENKVRSRYFSAVYDRMDNFKPNILRVMKRIPIFNSQNCFFNFFLENVMKFLMEFFPNGA